MRKSFTGVLFCLLGAVIACSSARHDETTRTFRVMTFNIRHGEGTDGAIDLERIARLIKESNAEIVALQEVDRWVKRSGRIDIMTTLSDLTGMTYAFGKNIEYDGGDYGNGFLTRFPILEERNYHYSMIRSGEQRGMLVLVLDVRGTEVVVVNTHLDFREDDAERLNNTEELKSALESYEPRPAIVCGDLNDHPSSRTLTSLQTHLVDVWEIAGHGEGKTYPAGDPAKRIDYILISKPSNSGSLWAPRTAQVLTSNASDHLPLTAELELLGN